MRPERIPDPARVRAVELATAKLDEACDDYSHGKPSAADIFTHAVRILREVKSETGVSLLMTNDPATGVTFS